MATGAVIARILTQYSDKGSKAASKDIARLGKNFDNFSRKAKMAFGVAAAASAAFAIKLGVDSVKAALQDEKAQVVLANALRNTVGASNEVIAGVEEYISKQQLLVNVSDSALRPSLAALLVATNDLTQAQALQAIALDTSAATGKDLQTVSIAIAKATTGNVGALKKLGVPLSDNIVKTKDFAGAIDVLKKSYGGAATALAKTDPLTTLNLAFGEIQETLGFALLPVVKEFANYIITDVLPVIESWIDLNRDKLAANLTTIAELVATLGKAVFNFIDYISRNLTTIKIFASLIAGIFVAAKVYAFATAIGLLIPTLYAFAAAAGSAGIATALLTAGVSAGAAAAALGAFVITAGAIGVSFAASAKNADKAKKSYKGVQDISSKLGATTSGLTKVVKAGTTVITSNITAVKKLTAEQLLSLKVQKQLQEQFGVKATSETDPTQLEAARLNLIKQQNLAIQAVDASYIAFIEKQMKANENAQRYNDILAVLKDNKITTEEIDNLAKAWGIPRAAVIAYITKVTGVAEADFSGLDAPGLAAASGWAEALKRLNEYFDALKKGATATTPATSTPGSIPFRQTPNGISPTTPARSIEDINKAVEDIGGVVSVIGASGKEFLKLVDGLAPVFQAVEDSGAFNALVNSFANGNIGSFNAGSARMAEGGSLFSSGGGGAYDRNVTVTIVDKTSGLIEVVQDAVQQNNRFGNSLTYAGGLTAS